jgi:hypothetical protein
VTGHSYNEFKGRRVSGMTTEKVFRRDGLAAAATSYADVRASFLHIRHSNNAPGRF